MFKCAVVNNQSVLFSNFLKKAFFTSALTFDEVAVESLKRDTAFVQKADHKFSFSPRIFLFGPHFFFGIIAFYF